MENLVTGGHAALPLVAVLRHTHQRLPVSLVSISAQGVATASHEGNIHRYMYQPPASPSTTDSHLRRTYSRSADDSGSGKSRREEVAQEGSFAGVEGATQELAESNCGAEEGGHAADTPDSMQGSTASPVRQEVENNHEGAASPEVHTSPAMPVIVSLLYAFGSACMQ